MDKKTRYGAIDGLRAFSAVGIVLMHVQANASYEIGGFIFEKLIPSFTNLVFLFMVISGFAMCCGYYDKVIQNRITAAEFYGKRFARVWPFFAVLCLLDFVISPSWNALFEVFANLTLCFGLLPNANIEVIGVGWFLGVVFVFYFLFPFFCYLLSDRRRAWLSFAAALVFNFLCLVRFDAGRSNIMFCAVFFLAGGLIFLYKEQLSRAAEKHGFVIVAGILASAAVYYLISQSVPVMLVLFSLMLVSALKPHRGHTLLQNPVTKFLSGISMEVYLCHMVAFRVLEKLHLTHLFASDILSFTAASLGTLAGAIALSIVIKKLIAFISKHYMVLHRGT